MNGKTCLDYANVNSSSYKNSSHATRLFFSVIIQTRYDRLYFTAWWRYRFPVTFRPLPLTVSVYVVGGLTLHDDVVTSASGGGGNRRTCLNNTGKVTCISTEILWF